MIELETAIKGLECCITGDPDSSRECKKCPYRRKGITNEPCFNALHADALAFLKAQMPRVMTKSEAEQYIAYGKHPTEYSKYPPLYVEYKFDQSYYIRWVTVDMAFVWLNDFDRSQEYGTEFRFWTARPTPEQMANTPWEGDEEDAE